MMSDVIKPEWIERIKANRQEGLRKRLLKGMIVIDLDPAWACASSTTTACDHSKFDGVTERCLACGEFLVRLYPKDIVHRFRQTVSFVARKIQ